jgi:hypothetical protein
MWNRKGAVNLAVLICIAVAVRLPLILVPAATDWDESTFLEVASRSARGELPYTSTFEIKPPWGLIFQTVPFILGLDNLGIFRLVAAVLLGLSAFLLTRIGFSGVASYWQLPGGVVLVLLYSSLESGMVWMSELNAVVVFAVALYLLWRFGCGMSSAAFWVGFSSSALALTRTNWAVAAALLALGGLLAAPSFRSRLVVILGIAAPPLLTVAVYAMTGHLSDLYVGAVVLPLSESSSYAAGFSIPEHMVALFVSASILLLGSAWLRWTRGGLAAVRFDVGVISLAASIVGVAALQAPDWPHHSLQMVPFLAVGLSRFTGALTIFEVRGSQRALAALVSVLSLTTAVVVAGPPIARYAVSIGETRQLLASQERLVAGVRELSGNGAKSVWALTDHYVYYVLGLKPIVPTVTHPSMVSKPGSLQAFHGRPVSPGEEIKRILDLEPEIVVMGPVGYLDDESYAVVKGELELYYRQAREFDPRIWVRLP